MRAGVSGYRAKKADPAQNLTDCARYLLGVGRREAPDVDDLDRLGAPQEVQDQAKEAAEEDIFWVLPECWDAVRLYLASQTQWRYAGVNGVRTGLDYAGVEAARRNLKIPRSAFQGVQVIELAVLKHQAVEK